VFLYEKALVKFFLNPFQQYSVTFVSVQDERVLETVRRCDGEVIVQRREELLNKLLSISDKLIIIV
jgi:hypothetical protein